MIFNPKNKEEYDEVVKHTDMGEGTYNTGIQALKQGKPLFVAMMSEKIEEVNQEKLVKDIIKLIKNWD